MADHGKGDDCADAHSTLRSRQSQMGTLGYLRLMASTTQPSRSLAARTVPALVVERFRLPPFPMASTDSSSRASPAAVVGSNKEEAGNESDEPPPLEDDSDADKTDTSSSSGKPVTRRRSARRPRRILGRPNVNSQQDRQRLQAGHISAALRRLLGMRTLVGASVGCGMMAQVVGAPSSRSRFLFCVTGPQAVDLANMWLSQGGATLCSCWGHTENVALLSMAGQDSTCWHAQAFKAALGDLHGHEAELSTHLLLASDVQPYAVDISTFRGAAAAAFDGIIYSPVVATRRCHIKCIAAGCRSAQRRSHHASLVRMLDHGAAAGDSSDDSSGDDGARAQHEDNEEESVIEEELIIISKDRQRRNLVSCTEEDRQGLLWARTAEGAAADVPVAAIFSPPPPAEDGQQALPTKSTTLLGRMAELGLAYNP